MTDSPAGARPLSDAEFAKLANYCEQTAKEWDQQTDAIWAGSLPPQDAEEQADYDADRASTQRMHNAARGIRELLARCGEAEFRVKRYEEVGLPLPAETTALRAKLAEAEAALARVRELLDFAYGDLVGFHETAVGTPTVAEKALLAKIEAELAIEGTP